MKKMSNDKNGAKSGENAAKGQKEKHRKQDDMETVQIEKGEGKLFESVDESDREMIDSDDSGCRSYEADPVNHASHVSHGKYK